MPSTAYLRSLVELPQLAPPADACGSERALHRRLLDTPAAVVMAHEIAAVADADARDKLNAFLAFRDRLLAAGPLESCYLALMRSGHVDVAPFFVDRLVQAIVRNLVDGGDDAFERRAAALLFRPQRVSTHAGRLHEIGTEPEHDVPFTLALAASGLRALGGALARWCGTCSAST